MPNKSYWQERFAQLEEREHQASLEYYAGVQAQMDRAQRAIQGEIEAWYGRIARNNEVSIDEARKMLRGKELDEFRWNVDEYIQKGRENAIDGKWMKELENASARAHISRLEAINIQVQNECEKLFGGYLDSFDKYIEDTYKDVRNHTAYEIQRGIGVGTPIIGIDKKQLEKIITKPWAVDGKNFSDRIWQSKAQLIDKLRTALTQGCILGKPVDKVIDEMSKAMNVSKSQAGRLIQTESAYFSNLATHDTYKELGVEEYEILATLDSHTSEICRSMDGKHFKVSQQEPGVNAPPFHPNCRSTTMPYFDDEFTEGEMRIARDEEGKSYYVPGNIKYPTWKKAFVDGDKSALEAFREIK